MCIIGTGHYTVIYTTVKTTYVPIRSAAHDDEAAAAA
jgi:hypothetical protein